MLEVRTHVLAPYDDLKLCRKLYETESPNCVSLKFFKVELPFSQSIHVLLDFLFGKQRCNSVPATLEQSSTVKDTSSGGNKFGLV